MNDQGRVSVVLGASKRLRGVHFETLGAFVRDGELAWALGADYLQCAGLTLPCREPETWHDRGAVARCLLTRADAALLLARLRLRGGRLVEAPEALRRAWESGGPLAGAVLWESAPA